MRRPGNEANTAKVIMNACCVQATHNASFNHIERTDRSDDKLAMEKKSAETNTILTLEKGFIVHCINTALIQRLCTAGQNLLNIIRMGR